MVRRSDEECRTTPIIEQESLDRYRSSGNLPCTNTMEKQPRCFEPITDRQNRKLHALARQAGHTPAELYARAQALIGIPSLTALSREEASLLIRQLEGSAPEATEHPLAPQTCRLADGTVRPGLAYVRAIRWTARDLGWNKQHLKNWLRKYTGAQRIRDLDADQARKAIIGLRKIQAYHQSHPGGTRREAP